MASGSLKGFSIKDMFEMLSVTGKTGILSVKTEHSSAEVFFSEGRLFHACTSCRKGHLSQMLVSERIITEEQMKIVEEDRKVTGAKIGEILAAKQIVPVENLSLFVREQIVDELYRIIDAETAEFAFNSFEEDPLSDIGVYLATEDVFDAAEHKNGEWRRIKEAIPSPSTSLVMSEELTKGNDVTFTAFEWRVLVKLTKLRTVGAVIESMGAKEFDVMKTMLNLLENEIVKKEEFKKAPQAAETANAASDVVVDINAKKADKTGKYVRTSGQGVEGPKAADGTPLEWEPYLTRLDEQSVEAKDVAKKAQQQ